MKINTLYAEVVNDSGPELREVPPKHCEISLNED